MTNLICTGYDNSCLTEQRAEVFECFLPSFLIGSEVSRYFLLSIKKCKKCGKKSIYAVGLTYSGSWVPYGYRKAKQFQDAESNIFQELDSLPGVKKYPHKKGFYLLFSEFGIAKKCYSNLSGMPLPVPKEVGVDVGQEEFTTSVDRYNKVVRER